MRYTLRFWAENISPGEIVQRALPLLCEYGAGVGIAVFGDSLTDENAAAFRQIKEAGVELVLWPLLSKEEGYFPFERNVPVYAETVKRLMDWARDNSCAPGMIAVDLELPFHQMMAVLEATGLGKVHSALGILKENRDPERYRAAKAGLIELNGWLHARDIETIAAALPWVALELEGDVELVQDMMETPVAGVGFDVLSPMLYASMLVGMTEGLVTARDADWLIFDSCVHLRARYGWRTAGVSLGVTGTGVLGNEPTFSRPEELMVGVEAALAAGVRDIGIYNLEGILERGPREWLDALRSARPRIPEKSKRVARLLNFLRAVYPVMGSHLES